MLKFRLSRPEKGAIDVRFEPDVGLISFVCAGVVTQADLTHAQKEADRLAAGRSVRSMMIDARQSSPGYPIDQLAEPMSAVLEDLRIKRCAFVSARGRDEILAMIETLTFPFAVRVRAFDTGTEARHWLLA
jgi:hypothetical protein